MPIGPFSIGKNAGTVSLGKLSVRLPPATTPMDNLWTEAVGDIPNVATNRAVARSRPCGRMIIIQEQHGNCHTAGFSNERITESLCETQSHLD